MSSTTSQDKLLKAQGHYSTDLVSLDFKSQSLQKFLEHVVSVVNQHSYKINQLEFDKLNTEIPIAANNKIANSINLTNPTVISQVVIKKDTVTDDKHADSVNRICNRLEYYNQSIDGIYKMQGERDNKLNLVQKQQQDFVKNQTLKDKLKRVKDEAKVYTDEEINKLMSRLKEVENKTNKKIGDFENLTKQVEKKTLWKITECQSSLTKKITAQYVEKAMDQLQQKINRQQTNNKNNDTNDLKFQVQNLTRSFDLFNRDNDQKIKSIKKAVKELEEQVKNFEKKQKVQSDKRELQTKIRELAFRADRLEKREDPQELEVRITKNIAENAQKITDVSKRLRNIQEQFESINQMLSSMKGGEGGNDPHKICHMDAEIKRLKDYNITNQSKISSLEQQLKTKLLIFEQRISSSLAMMRNQQNNVTREELYQSVNRVKQPVNQKLNDYQNLLNEINGKLQKIDLFEKATKRKIKDLTKGEDFNKILDMKMNTSQAKLLIDGFGMKLQNLEVYCTKLKMELEANSSFLKEIHDKMGGVQEGFSIIGGKQRIFPAKCLACGMKHLPHKQPGQMQGTDGRFYRVDMKNTCMYDSDQVFDVVPSQITLLQTAKKQSRISSAKGRKDEPMSTGMSYGYRPHSAKKS